jgi:hypothetical protein
MIASLFSIGGENIRDESDFRAVLAVSKSLGRRGSGVIRTSAEATSCEDSLIDLMITLLDLSWLISTSFSACSHYFPKVLWYQDGYSTTHSRPREWREQG